MNNKTLTQKIISLWLNGYTTENIALKLDCTLEQVNKVVEREIYHLTEVK